MFWNRVFIKMDFWKVPWNIYESMVLERTTILMS